jgi:hypothetical protein
MWDTTLIRAMEYNWPTFVDNLEAGWLTTDAAKNDNKDDPVAWVEDAHNAAIAFNVWVDAGATQRDEFACPIEAENRTHRHHGVCLAECRILRVDRRVVAAQLNDHQT